MLLEEFLKPLGVTQSELAHRLGVSFPRLNEIIRGKRAMTPDTALRLARVLGMSAEFWLGLQLDWDLWRAAGLTFFFLKGYADLDFDVQAWKLVQWWP